MHIVNTKSRDTLAAKIWLDSLEISEKGDLTNAELNIALKLISNNKEEIKSKILNFANGRRSKPLALKLK